MLDLVGHKTSLEYSKIPILCLVLRQRYTHQNKQNYSTVEVDPYIIQYLQTETCLHLPLEHQLVWLRMYLPDLNYEFITLFNIFRFQHLFNFATNLDILFFKPYSKFQGE